MARPVSKLYAPRVPYLVKVVVAAVGIGIPALRTKEEWFPHLDETTLLTDRHRLNIIYSIMHRLDIPVSVGNKLSIVVGKHNSLRGGLNSKPGPILELTPQLVKSLGRPDFAVDDKRSEQAVAMRTKIFTDPSTNTQIPLLCAFPFEAEREAVVAHELIHLKQNHSSGIVRLNALMACAGAAFYVKPIASLVPLTAYFVGLHFYTKHCELEADRLACLSLGPDTTRSMLDRHISKQKLDKIVFGKYSWDQPAFRMVILDRIWSYLFHVPLDTRISYLKSILKEQLAAKGDTKKPLSSTSKALMHSKSESNSREMSNRLYKDKS